MNRGKLYGVGVGPGDPELLTRKAERIIRASAVLAVPDKGAGEKTALNIIGPLAHGKERLDCSTPMVRDQAVLDGAYDAAADAICEKLDQGKDVAFITLGDPTVYSTYIYIHRRAGSPGGQRPAGAAGAAAGRAEHGYPAGYPRHGSGAPVL